MVYICFNLQHDICVFPIDESLSMKYVGGSGSDDKISASVIYVMFLPH
jgi:hypothetical protein